MMEKIISVLVFCFLFSSCGKEEELNRSGVLVNFKLELNGRDSDLQSLYHFEEFTEPRNSGEYLGAAGLLIFNAGYDDYAQIELKAFDLSCRHEGNASVRVKANSDRKAVCPVCKSEYSLTERGRCMSGPALDKFLWQYSVLRENAANNIFVVRSY